MNSDEIIYYKKSGFNNQKYLELQKEKILSRIDNFRGGKLYLEIGGKFLHDPHAARVLPGFDPANKKLLLQSLKNIIEVLFCVNAQDVISNRQLKNREENYRESVFLMLENIHQQIGIKPIVVINLCKHPISREVEAFQNDLEAKGYKIYKRYFIEGYPQNVEKILSSEGYGGDESIETSKNLIVVVGAASNSGKMSTCLGQIYLDTQNGINSGYAKYETFPIWTLPINHPVNLAYEAATADIGDFNVLDHYHEKAYGKRSVNYNRDVEAFEIVKSIGEKFLPEDNFMRSYKSPTDMGINYAGFAIENDEVVCVASLQEIERRGEWYQEMVDRGNGSEKWVQKCESLKNQALKYVNERGFDQYIKLD